MSALHYHVKTKILTIIKNFCIFKAKYSIAKYINDLGALLKMTINKFDFLNKRHGGKNRFLFIGNRRMLFLYIYI